MFRCSLHTHPLISGRVTTVFPALKPKTKSDIVRLEQWLTTRISAELDRDVVDHQLDASMILDEMQLIFDQCAYEIVRYMSSDCVEAGELRLNGEKLYLRGILDQGYFPGGWYTPLTDEAIQSDVELTLAMGLTCLSMFSPRV